MRYVTSLILSLPLVGAYAMFAIGIVLIHRASRVLNLAHGAMAMVPAYVAYSLSKAGLSALISILMGIVSGAALGILIERVFVRRLRPQGPTAQTVGTVAALTLLIAIAARIYGTSSLDAVGVFPRGGAPIGASEIQYGELGTFLVMLAVAAALITLLNKTDLGLKMRGTAENRLAAALHGVDPDRMTALAWAIGGGIAGAAGILIAATTSLHPFQLPLQALPGFIAALIGGLASIQGAILGAAIVGVVQAMVPVLGLGGVQGAPQLFLAILAIVVMARRGESLTAGDSRAGT